MSKNRIGKLHEKLALIEADCYLIDKGVRRAAYHYINNDYNHINQVEELVLKEYKMYIFYDESASDENIRSFFIYGNPVTRLFINVIDGTEAPVVRQYLVGVLLGYSEEDNYQYFKASCAEFASEYKVTTEEVEKAYYEHLMD